MDNFQKDVEKLRAYFDSARDRSPVNVSTMVDAIKDTGIDLTVDIVEAMRAGFAREGSIFPAPLWLAVFIASLINKYKPLKMLDPWLGSGLLANIINERCLPELFDGFELNTAAAEFNELLHQGKINVINGEPMQLLDDIATPYDAIISIPPFGLHSSKFKSIKFNNVEIKDYYGELLIAKACFQLAENGIGIFVVTPSFFSKQKKKSVCNLLPQLGYSIISCIELPSGSFSPLTSIPTCLILIKKAIQSELFVGEYSFDEKHQKTLLENLNSHFDGENISQGQWIPFDEFVSFRKLEAKERANRIAKRLGFKAYPMEELVIEKRKTPNKPSSEFEPLEHIPNSVYLPLTGYGPARTSQEDFGKLKHYVQLKVNPELASATFVANLLNKPIGQAIREQATFGATIPHLNIKHFLQLDFFLPDKIIQDSVDETLENIAQINNELKELENNIWNKPSDIKNFNKELKNINHEDRMQDWLEGLPYPLASILWSYHAHTGSEKGKYEKLIHFFEALAEFQAIICLSAFKSAPFMWELVNKKLEVEFEKNHLDFNITTFATWNTAFEILAKETRRLINSNDNNEREQCFQAFGTHDRITIESLVSKSIITTLKVANQIRNQWVGHAGAISEAKAIRIHNELYDSLAKLRELLSGIWQNNEMILPGETRFKEGIFQYKAKRIMGTRTPFVTISIETIEPLDDGCLYIKSLDENKALKLLPFVKILASPKFEVNACYFYNRREKKGERFISYHFEAESNLVESFSDVEEAIESIFTGA